MRGRLGNGMVLWLGGALLAHAALLALPGASPDGDATSTEGLKVRLSRAGAPVSAPANATATAGSTVTATEPVIASTAEAIATETIAADRQVEVAERPGNEPDAGPKKGSVTISATSSPKKVSDPFTDRRPEVPERPLRLKSDLQEIQEQVADAGRASTRPTASSAPAEIPLPASGQTGAEAQAHARLLELTDRLHRAIEREKRYPLSARRLGREGTASVAFQLRPDGAIDAIQVAASSGEPALDRAALRAVAGISPFDAARDYLDESAPFRVDIAFRLR